MASAFEWFATYLLIAPPDGKMRKDDVKAVYNVCLVFLLVNTNDLIQKFPLHRAQSSITFLEEKYLVSKFTVSVFLSLPQGCCVVDRSV